MGREAPQGRARGCSKINRGKGERETFGLACRDPKPIQPQSS